MPRGFIAIVISLASLCAGCNTDQPVRPPIAATPGQAMVSVTRSNDAYSMLTPVAIDINGAHVADLAVGATYTGAVAPGPILLTATTSTSPGRYVLRFNAAPGGRYAFFASPRGSQLAAQMVGGLVGLMADTAANGDQSGAFKITPVSQ